MPLSTKLKLACSAWLLWVSVSFGQQVKSFAVMLERDGSSLPVKIKWNYDPDAVSYTVYRRTPASANWGLPIATKAVNDTFFSDPGASSGLYEYYVEKKLPNNFTGHGYLLVNSTAAPLARSQRVLILIDNNYLQPLQGEIAQLIRDYASDGWFVDTLSVLRTETPAQVKARIINWYDTWKNDPVRPQSLYLLGHIPVPYSGAIFPDGHRPDHRGAWPADVYYGVMNESIWTDSQVSIDSAAQSRNHNFPGDGKFDIDYIFPDTSSLEIGRVDLTSMPAFPDNDTILTRTYLQKAHAFKTHQLIPQRKAIIDDHFGAMNGEAFAANGYRSFSTMVGAGSVVAGDFLPSVKQESYLLAYGSGAGTYTSAFGVANTPNLVSDSINTVFTMLFGSYFGDWDNENNFLRAPLCSKPMALASAWNGRPSWPLHHMALGFSIGHCARMAQNNIDGRILVPPVFTGYRHNNFPSFVHIALMGDPGLRLFYNEMPRNVSAQPNSDSTAYTISWDAVPGADTYHIYASTNPMHAGRNIGNTNMTSFSNAVVSRGVNHVYVRAAFTETSASGSFEQVSLGTYITLFGGVNASGVDELRPGLRVNVYPNPSRQVITLQGDFVKAGVAIYDIMGRQVRTFSAFPGEAVRHDLQPGMYLLHLESDGKEAVHKLLVE